jgi:hypothetical protein
MRVTALATLGALLFAVPAFAQDAGEITFWQSVKDSKNPAELQAYLQSYPHGTFAALARLRMKELGATPAAEAAPAPAAQTAAQPAAPAANAETPARPAAPTATEAAWQEFRSAEGRFSVLFPAEPKASFNPPDSSGHSEHRFAVERNGGAFMVAYDDFAPGRVGPQYADEVLTQAQKALLAGMNGKLREENPATLDGRPGKQIIFETADHTVGKLRVFVGQNRLYQVLFVGPAGQESSPDADRFFASFKLAAAEPAAPVAQGDGLTWHQFRAASAGFAIELPGEAAASVTPPKPNGRSESRWVVDQGLVRFGRPLSAGQAHPHRPENPAGRGAGGAADRDEGQAARAAAGDAFRLSGTRAVVRHVRSQHRQSARVRGAQPALPDVVLWPEGERDPPWRGPVPELVPADRGLSRPRGRSDHCEGEA